MIRVLIAAASAVTRAGLEALVASAPGLVVVGSFPDLAAVADLRPDVVLGAFPVEDIPAFAESPLTYVLLSAGPGQALTIEALRAGVRAILPPSATPSAILAATEAAANGMAAVEPHELEELLSATHQPASAGETSELTARERDVLSLMAEGAANKTIAWKLSISEHTVKFHVASILGKLNAGSRTEAVAIGIRKGIVMI